MENLQQLFEEYFDKEQVNELKAEDYYLGNYTSIQDMLDLQAKEVIKEMESQLNEHYHRWIQDEDWISESLGNDYYGRIAIYKNHIFEIPDEDEDLVNLGEIW